MIKLHQIYYLPSQLPLLDPAFIPYNNTANRNREFAEFYIFEKEYNRGKIRRDAITGYVSWKFGVKTGLTGKQFREFIEKNPGYDVYFVTPFITQAKLFRNVWLQGDFYHPGMLQLAQEVFDRAGYTIDLANQKHGRNTTLYCNYWAGSREFWDTYMDFAAPIVKVLRNMLRSKTEAQRLLTIADHTNKFGYIAFILERVFSTLLSYNTAIRCKSYPDDFASIAARYGRRVALSYFLLPDNPIYLGWIYRRFKKTSHELSKE